MEYNHLAKYYNDFLAKQARVTWRAGILSEIKALGIRSGRVLDLGTGTGIGAKLLRENGNYHLTLLDRNKQMLAKAARHSDIIVLMDMVGFKISGKKFDLIISGFESMNYLAPHQLQETFTAVARHLSIGGMFIFDYASPHFFQKNCTKLSYSQRAGRFTLEWKHSYKPVSNQTITMLSLFSGKRKAALWTEKHTQYALTPDALKSVLEQTSLAIIRVRNLNGGGFSTTHRAHVYTIKNKI